MQFGDKGNMTREELDRIAAILIEQKRAGQFRAFWNSAIPENARKHMSAAEWNFWYEGQPASEDIIDPFGKKIESQGAVRDGGSFNDRMGNVVCWNSVMDEQTYLVQKWNKFVAA